MDMGKNTGRWVFSVALILLSLSRIQTVALEANGAPTSPGAIPPGSSKLFQPEAVIIHETLHSLGLGENPPTSDEITWRVFSRCG